MPFLDNEGLLQLADSLEIHLVPKKMLAATGPGQVLASTEPEPGKFVPQMRALTLDDLPLVGEDGGLATLGADGRLEPHQMSLAVTDEQGEALSVNTSPAAGYGAQNWISLPLINGAEPAWSTLRPKYSRRNGLVTLSGHVRLNTTAATVFAQLPVGYRPGADGWQYLQTIHGDNNATPVHIRVTSDGNVSTLSPVPAATSPLLIHTTFWAEG